MIIALYLAHLRQSYNSLLFWGLILFGNRGKFIFKLAFKLSNDFLIITRIHHINSSTAVAGYYLQESHTKVFSLLMLSWFLPSLVLSSGYKAVFFSMLTVPHHTNLVDNVEQLKQNPDIAVHVIRDASVQELFLVIYNFFTIKNLAFLVSYKTLIRSV